MRKSELKNTFFFFLNWCCLVGSLPLRGKALFLEFLTAAYFIILLITFFKGFLQLGNLLY